MNTYDEIQEHNASRKVNILKGFVEVGDLLEKARQVGDIHPNGKWVWKQLPSGKFDWRTIPGGGNKTTAPKDDTKIAVIGSSVELVNHQDLPSSLFKLGSQKLKVVGYDNGTLTVPKFLVVEDKNGDKHSINPRYTVPSKASEPKADSKSMKFILPQQER